jgi:hypothetical protein
MCVFVSFLFVLIEKAKDASFKGKVKLVTSGNALCPTYAAKYQVFDLFI